jgi:anti-sigma regulatory factor (Ser/Thr protein kinase)
VSFVDRDTWYLRPATTIAGYDRTLTRLTRAGAPRVRAIGEVAFGTTPDQWAEWTAYEAILNRALARHPAWVVCPYDARVLPDRVLKDAVHTHDDHDDHDALVRSHALPFEALPELRTVPLGAGARGWREQLARELVAARVPDAQARDLILAAGELLANARRHGEGPFTLRVGRAHGRFVCELSDRGAGLDDPYAGYLPPQAGGGAGLWVARQLVWRLELASGPGLTARLWL